MEFLNYSINIDFSTRSCARRSTRNGSFDGKVHAYIKLLNPTQIPVSVMYDMLLILTKARLYCAVSISSYLWITFSTHGTISLVPVFYKLRFYLSRYYLTVIYLHACIFTIICLTSVPRLFEGKIRRMRQIWDNPTSNSKSRAVEDWCFLKTQRFFSQLT